MKKRILAILTVFILCVSFAVFASSAELESYADSTSSMPHPPRLVDNAGLLDEQEFAALENSLNEISNRQNIDVAIVTVNSLDGKTATEYADDFYDYNGYGIGESNDGIILLVDMGSRKWAISTCGNAIDIFTDDSQDNITNIIIPFLSDGKYYSAFNEFADLCDDIITASHENGIGNYDSVFDGRKPIPKLELIWIPICIAIGAVIAFAILSVMKSKLKTVKPDNDADCYIRSGSVNITRSNDIFLYRHVTRTERPRDNNHGGGGSSTHVSSSGTTHGGSSGSF